MQILSPKIGTNLKQKLNPFTATDSVATDGKFILRKAEERPIRENLLEILEHTSIN